jgi:hypothetical protein
MCKCWNDIYVLIFSPPTFFLFFLSRLHIKAYKSSCTQIHIINTYTHTHTHTHTHKQGIWVLGDDELDMTLEDRVNFIMNKYFKKDLDMCDLGNGSKNPYNSKNYIFPYSFKLMQIHANILCTLTYMNMNYLIHNNFSTVAHMRREGRPFQWDYLQFSLGTQCVL